MKILIVDDHALIRDAIRSVLIELRNDAEIDEAPDSGKAMQCLDKNPDIELILLDLYLPDRSGFDFLTEFCERSPMISIVVLSMSNDRDDITRALELGAVGFIPKSAQRDVILNALRLIFSGGVYVPPEIFSKQSSESALLPRLAETPSAAELGLTARQMEVLSLMMQGKSNKAICRMLDITEPTVKNHVTAILRALKVTNRTEAVIAAGALGLGTQGDAG